VVKGHRVEGRGGTPSFPLTPTRLADGLGHGKLPYLAHGVHRAVRMIRPTACHLCRAVTLSWVPRIQASARGLDLGRLSEHDSVARVIRPSMGHMELREALLGPSIRHGNAVLRLPFEGPRDRGHASGDPRAHANHVRALFTSVGNEADRVGPP
jgi:hypothetical protein